MGSNSLFDPINSIEAFGLGSFNQDAANVGVIPNVTSATGAILPQAEKATFSEGEEATVRHNITKKRLGTAQLRIPLANTGVESNPDL